MKLIPILKLLVLVVIIAFAGSAFADDVAQKADKPEVTAKTTSQCCAKDKTAGKCDPAKCTGDKKTCTVKDCTQTCSADKKASCTKSSEKKTVKKGACGSKCSTACPASKKCNP